MVELSLVILAKLMQRVTELRNSDLQLVTLSHSLGNLWRNFLCLQRRSHQVGFKLSRGWSGLGAGGGYQNVFAPTEIQRRVFNQKLRGLLCQPILSYQ